MYNMKLTIHLNNFLEIQFINTNQSVNEDLAIKYNEDLTSDLTPEGDVRDTNIFYTNTNI